MAKALFNGKQPQAMIVDFDPTPNSTRFSELGAFYHVTINAQNIQQNSPFKSLDKIFFWLWSRSENIFIGFLKVVHTI